MSSTQSDEGKSGLTLSQKIMSKKYPFDPRKFMEKAIKVMNDSIHEDRDDGKVVPHVGAVLIDSDGNFVEEAYRGELRDGDHAEYTLIDKKLRDRDLSDHILFATLEPCAPKSRSRNKTCCASRIANARISEVWVGIEDPDPTVARKGIEHLKKKGVEVHMFDRDLQEKIEKVNEEFLEQATERAEEVEEASPQLSDLEGAFKYSEIKEFSNEAFHQYEQKANLPYTAMSEDFYKMAERKGIVEFVEENGQREIVPTGMGLLSFGREPRERFPQAVVKAEVRYGNEEPEIRDFDEPLVLIPEEIESWLKKVLRSKLARERFEREEISEFPIEVIREAVVNAIIHRDYDNKNAKSYLEIDDHKIVIKSPGEPIDPIKLEDLQKFEAPSLSRNPVLSHIFNQMGFAEERGIGMKTLRSMPEKYNLPLPEYSYEEPFLVLTFPRSKEYFENLFDEEILDELNDEETEGLIYVRDQGNVSKSEYADHFGYGNKKAQRHLAKMRELDLIELKGKGPASRYYYIHDE